MIWMDVDTALSEVPVNVAALIDDTDFKTREESVVYNQAGMDLVWNFIDTGGNASQTAVTPTTSGLHDWINQGNGMYTLEIPDTGGTINNNTEGFGYFTGFATGILPWRGPTIGFRAAALNNALIDGGDNLDVNTVQWLGTAVTLSGNSKPNVDMRESIYDGKIWMDIANGAAGTVLDVNGTKNNRVDSIADALTLSVSLGVIEIDVLNSTIILPAAGIAGYSLFCRDKSSVLNLNSRDITGANAEGFTIVGVGTSLSSGMTLFRCKIQGVTLPSSILNDCSFRNTFDVSANDDSLLVINGRSEDTDYAVFDFNDFSNVTLVFTGWSGKVTFRNLSESDSSVLIIGEGEVEIESTCTAGAIVIYGGMKVIDSSAGTTVTVNNYDVNVAKWLESAVTLSTGNKPDVNIDEISDDSVAPGNLELALENGQSGFIASDARYLGGALQSLTDLKDFADAGYDPVTHKIQGVVLADIVTALTGHTAQTGDNFGRLGAPAGPSVSADIAAVKVDTGNLVTRITATLFSGITSLAEWLGLMAGKQTGDATARTELRATGAGSGTFDETSESQEAIRDRGDANWTTGGGGAISQIINLEYSIPVIGLADTARIGMSIINSVDDLPTAAEITPGTITIERKAVGDVSWTAIVTDAACSESDGLIYYDEVFDSGSGYAEGDSLQFTFKSQSVTADANTFEINGTVGTIKQTYIRETMRGTDNLISGSGESITPATSSSVVSTGTVASGTYASTLGKDGVYWQIQDDTGAMEAVIWFNVGSTGVPRSIQLHGRLTSSNDTLSIWAYDRVAAAYLQVGTLVGTNLSVDTDHSYDIYNTMVEDGIVKLRLYAASGLTTANLYIDQIFCAFSEIKSSTGYEGGSVWLNTTLGSEYAGSVSDVNGVADFASNNIADVNLILANKSLNRVYVLAGSSVTFAASQQSQQFEGCNWNLALGGQDISNSRFACAVVTGIASASSEVIFDNCSFGSATLPPGTFTKCCFGKSGGTFTAASAGEYAILDPHSVVPGAGTPAFIFNGLGSASGINYRGHNGGTTWTLDSDCTLSLEVHNGGKQQITTGGASVEIRGNIRELNLILSGAGTVQFVGVVGVINISGTATTTVNLYGASSEINDTSSGTTIVDKTINYDDIQLILDDTNETQGKLPAGNICDDTTPLDSGGVQGACDSAITANSTIAGMNSKTNNLPSDPASETNVNSNEAKIDTLTTNVSNLNDVSEAQVNAQCDAALADYGGPTRAEATSDKAEIIVEVDANETKIDNVQSDLNTANTNINDLQARVPAALVSGRISSDLGSVAGQAAEASTLQKALSGTVTGAAVSGTLTNTTMTTNLAESTDDHYNGRIITWITGDLAGQSTDITDYDGTTKMLTFTTVTDVPSAVDEFTIT